MSAAVWRQARANDRGLRSMPCVPASVKSPTFKSFKQVIARWGIVGTLRAGGGGSLAGRAAPGSKTKRWISSCLWPTGDAVCSVFFALLSVLRTIGHPFAEDLWARARGREGAKNDRSPRRGTGIRASRPRPPCPGLDGQGAPWACHLSDAARHRHDGDVLRCDIWTWTRRGEPKPPPRGPTDDFHCEPVEDGKDDIALLPFWQCRIHLRSGLRSSSRFGAGLSSISCRGSCSRAEEPWRDARAEDAGRGSVLKRMDGVLSSSPVLQGREGGEIMWFDRAGEGEIEEVFIVRTTTGPWSSHISPRSHIRRLSLPLPSLGVFVSSPGHCHILSSSPLVRPLVLSHQRSGSQMPKYFFRVFEGHLQRPALALSPRPLPSFLSLASANFSSSPRSLFTRHRLR